MMEHILISLYSVTVGMKLNILKRFYVWQKGRLDTFLSWKCNQLKNKTALLLGHVFNPFKVDIYIYIYIYICSDVCSVLLLPFKVVISLLNFHFLPYFWQIVCVCAPGGFRRNAPADTLLRENLINVCFLVFSNSRVFVKKLHRN